MISKAIQSAIERLARLPGIGPRHAARLAFFLIRAPKNDVKTLTDSLGALKEKIKTCPICFLSFEVVKPDQKTCAICADTKRLRTSLCVVEKEMDIDPIETTGLFKGVYHVVGDDVDTFEKTPPLPIARLRERVAYIAKQLPPKKKENMEVILAMSATVEGDALASYLHKMLKPLGVTVTRLGRGLASGSELEYADQDTLTQALTNRK